MRVSIHYFVKICFIFVSFFCILFAQDSDKIAHILQSQSNARISMETTAGTMEFELFTKIAPKAVENFLRLADRGFYNGVGFHRIIKGFMIQGGDPTGTGKGGDSIWGDVFEDEIALGYAFDRGGLLAMANAGANTNRSQFFITTSSAPWLNGRHTIFGEIKSGFEVLNALENTATDSEDRPFDMPRIVRINIL